MLSNESLADLEKRFQELPKGHPALPPYGIFKLANRQIWGNIAIGLGNRLSVFQNPLVDKITSYNEIDLMLPGKSPAPISAASPPRIPLWSFSAPCFSPSCLPGLWTTAAGMGTTGGCR